MDAKDLNPWSVGLDIGTNLLNFGYGVYNNERNRAYQEQLNNMQMSREDSAFQRAVTDAQAAGLSKAVVGSGASSQSLNAMNTSVPQLQSNAIQRAMNRASLAQMQNQNELLQAQVAKAEAETKKAENDILFQNGTLAINDAFNTARINNMNAQSALYGIQNGLMSNDLFFSNKNKEYYGNKEYLDNMKKLADEQFKASFSGLKFENAMNNFKLANQTLMKVSDVLKLGGSTLSSYAPFAFMMMKGLNGFISPQRSSVSYWEP